MKSQAIIILLAIALGVVAPPSLPLMIHHGTGVAIGTLDLCHSSAPALFSSVEMPGISMYPLPYRYFAISAIAENHDPLARPFYIVFHDERPPEHLL
jgi:hypothetical protein